MSGEKARRFEVERAVMEYLTRNASSQFKLRYTTAIQWHLRHGKRGFYASDDETLNALRRLERAGSVDYWVDDSRGWYRRRVWFVTERP